MKTTVLILAAVLLLIPSAHSAEKPDRPGPTNLATLKAAAEKGDAKSQLEYGKAIREKQRDEATRWIQKAADQGLGEAWYWLGYAGLGKEQAFVYYKKAAEKGYPEAFPLLLDELLFRGGASADVVAAKKFADLARQLKIKTGYDSEAMFATVDRCYEVGSPVIPQTDQPTPGDKFEFVDSDIECFQYKQGVDVKTDLQKYRKCLLSQPEPDNNSLAEIYANGWGVKRDAKLAMALVCHGSSVPAELMGMVKTLHESKDKKSLDEPFTFCNHVTSGMNGGFCAAQSEKEESKIRDGEFVEIARKWTKPQKSSFESLKKLANEFFSERASGEQDMSGTARAQIAIEEESRLNAEFLESIKNFEAGKLPSDTTFIEADKDLNKFYSTIMKAEPFDMFGTVSKESIKLTQRKWLKYRDAWVKFAALKYPKTSADVWKTWLTRQRVGQLKELIPTN